MMSCMPLYFKILTLSKPIYRCKTIPIKTSVATFVENDDSKIYFKNASILE